MHVKHMWLHNEVCTSSQIISDWQIIWNRNTVTLLFDCPPIQIEEEDVIHVSNWHLSTTRALYVSDLPSTMNATISGLCHSHRFISPLVKAWTIFWWASSFDSELLLFKLGLSSLGPSWCSQKPLIIGNASRIPRDNMSRINWTWMSELTMHLESFHLYHCGFYLISSGTSNQWLKAITATIRVIESVTTRYPL